MTPPSKTAASKATHAPRHAATPMQVKVLIESVQRSLEGLASVSATREAPVKVKGDPKLAGKLTAFQNSQRVLQDAYMHRIPHPPAPGPAPVPGAGGHRVGDLLAPVRESLGTLLRLSGDKVTPVEVQTGEPIDKALEAFQDRQKSLQDAFLR
jgi:hypothetical protein